MLHITCTVYDPCIIVQIEIERYPYSLFDVIDELTVQQAVPSN